MTQIFPSWADVAPNLIAVAAGREAADRVFQNCNLVNVQTREVLNGWQVAVAKGRFAYIGPNASHCIGDETDVLMWKDVILYLVYATVICTSRVAC